MTSSWITAISGVCGAIIGGFFSLVGTLISLKSERKRQEETEKRHFEQEMIWHAVEKKENLYLELTDIICSLQTIYCDENGNYDNRYLDDVIAKMSTYVNENNNRITLYASEQLKKELHNLRKIMMEIHSKKLSLISHDDMKELESMIVQADKIETFMRKELGIPEPQKEEFLYKSNMKEENKSCPNS